LVDIDQDPEVRTLDDGLRSVVHRFGNDSPPASRKLCEQQDRTARVPGAIGQTLVATLRTELLDTMRDAGLRRAYHPQRPRPKTKPRISSITMITMIVYSMASSLSFA